MIQVNTKARLTTLICGFLTFYSIIVINLYRIQILKKSKFLNLAEKQYKIKVTKEPLRGKILDRNNKLIVANKENFSAFIMPHKVNNPEQLFTFLKKYYPESYKKFDTYKNKFFMYIKRRLTEKEISRIEKEKIEDIQFIKEPSRFYPHKSLSLITGITDIDNNGLFGMEAIFNKKLAGEPATYILEKDARSNTFYFKKEIEKAGKQAENLKLTIDKDLQFLSYQEVKNQVKKFKAQEGAALILDPTNGHILSMVNYPTFNPIKLSELDQEKTKNKCVTESYELGSVMKVFVAIGALEENLVTPEEEIDCENSKEAKINGMKFSTVHVDGIIPFSRVMETSNNIGIAKVATRLGPKIVEYYKKMGFGKKTQLSLPGEQEGFINPSTQWSKRSIISLSLGYEITATLLQLARAFGIISNNGKDITPKIIFESNSKKPKHVISKKTVNQIKEILKNTVSQGTAKRALIKGYDIMGKTGTANMVVDGKYSYDHNVYTFAGIIEKEGYKRVVVTFLKDSELKRVYASQVTAPLFNRITEKMLIHEKVIN